MAENTPDFSTVLEVLTKHDVDFIVVGGVCAVLLGAPIATFDVDIVHSRTSKNINRLSAALEEMNAHYRDHLPHQLKPTQEALARKTTTCWKFFVK